jgi:DNA-binding NarL/FixJ family response regulator
MDSLVDAGRSEQSQFVGPAFDLHHSEGDAEASTSISLVDAYTLPRSCFAQALEHSLGRGMHIRQFSNIDDAVADSSDFSEVIVLCTHSNTEALVNAALEALGGTGARLLVVTDEKLSTLYSFLKNAIRAGVCGIISTEDTELRKLNAAIAFTLKGGAFVPPELFMQDSADDEKPKASRRSPDQLTNRQAEVLVKVREGKPNKIIAYELGMSESTVKVHIRSIMSKVGATNRTQVAFKTQAYQYHG